MAGEKCGECGYDIAACNEIAMLRMALAGAAIITRGRYEQTETGTAEDDILVCTLCAAQAPPDKRHQPWHADGCILGPRACDMAAATEVARAFEDRRLFGGVAGFVMVDSTMPGGLRRVDPASVIIKFPTTVDEGKL